MEAAHLGALGLADSVISRARHRRSLPSGPHGAFRVLLQGARELAVHGQPGAARVMDSALVVLERELGDPINRQSFDAYYLAGRHDRALDVLDSLRARGTRPAWWIDGHRALIAARRNGPAPEGSLADRICAGRPRPGPTSSDEVGRLTLCARIAAVAGRRDEARRLLRAAFSGGLRAAEVQLIGLDLYAIRDDPLVRRAERIEANRLIAPSPTR